MVLTGRRALTLSGGGAHESEAAMGGYSEVMGPKTVRPITSPSTCRRPIASCSTTSPCASPAPTALDLTIRRPIGLTAPCRTAPTRAPGTSRAWGMSSTRPRTPPAAPFAIRPVMTALRDHDAGVLERWPDHADSHPAIVWDSRLDGWPVTIIGIESYPRLVHGLAEPRLRPSGTLFPQASRKIARAINAASGRRGVVLLANLAGFDGSAGVHPRPPERTAPRSHGPS